MARRLRALFLLMLSTMLFALQGQTVVQCLCSGQIALGTAPEPCCEECPESIEIQLSTADTEHRAALAIVTCEDACFRMAVAESDTPFPPVLHVDAPVPTVVFLAADPAILDREHLSDPSPAWVRESLHRPAPVGPPCTILYGALLI